jgi:hypothetical protein
MDYVANMHGDHLDWIRRRVSLLLVCGQGQWEDATGALENTRRFAGVLGAKGSVTSWTSGATTCRTTGRPGGRRSPPHAALLLGAAPRGARPQTGAPLHAITV